MPYRSNRELPKPIKDNLPQGAQTIYRKAYNNAHKHYWNSNKRRGNASLTEVCNKVAWTAVKQSYVKEGDKWVKR